MIKYTDDFKKRLDLLEKMNRAQPNPLRDKDSEEDWKEYSFLEKELNKI